MKSELHKLTVFISEDDDDQGDDGQGDDAQGDDAGDK